MRTLLGASAAAAMLLLGISAYAQDAKKPAPAPKATSPCKGLDETACKAKAECQWITPKKGKQKPYCKLKTVPKKAKTEAPKKDAPKDTPKK